MKYLVYLSLGSNLGNKQANLEAGLELLSEAALTIITQSPYYETPPYGYADQDSFINMAALVETDLSPQMLLRRIHEIEACCGRVREIHWGPRTLDIDILLYYEIIAGQPKFMPFDQPDLQIPHPELAKRAFVLMPLVAIEEDLTIPNFGSIKELLAQLPLSDVEGIKIL